MVWKRRIAFSFSSFHYRSNAESAAITFAHFDHFRLKSLESFLSENGRKGRAVFRTVTSMKVDDYLL
jgi:hypothetical protein